MVLVVLLLIIVAYFSVQLRRVNNELYVTRTDFSKVHPINGKDGVDGINGLDGLPGKDSVSTKETIVIEKPTIVQQNIPIPGIQGEQGIQGAPGKSGREVVMGVKDGIAVWKYVGDLSWQPLEEVQ